MNEAVKKWLEIAEDDIRDADILLAGKRYSGALLHLQQAVEKALKAHCFVKTGDIPPKSHDLMHLLKLAKLKEKDLDMVQLKELSLSYIRLRYPDLDSTYYSNKEAVLKLIIFAKETFQWIKKQLPKS